MRGVTVSKPVVLAVRIVVSILVALFLAFFFFRSTSVPVVLGLSVALLGLAYLLEYLRRRNEDEDS